MACSPSSEKPDLGVHQPSTRHFCVINSACWLISPQQPASEACVTWCLDRPAPVTLLLSIKQCTAWILSQHPPCSPGCQSTSGSAPEKGRKGYPLLLQEGWFSTLETSKSVLEGHAPVSCWNKMHIYMSINLVQSLLVSWHQICSPGIDEHIVHLGVVFGENCSFITYLGTETSVKLQLIFFLYLCDYWQIYQIQVVIT